MINIMSIMVHVKDARTSTNSTQQRLCDNNDQGKHLAKRLFDLSNKKVSPSAGVIAMVETDGIKAFSFSGIKRVKWALSS